MNSVKGKHVFLSGPMSNEPDYGAPAFAHAHAVVKRLGAYKVYNPAIQWLTERGAERRHEDYMLDCIHELTSSEGRNIFSAYEPSPRIYSVIVMLPGWESSSGSRLEYAVAAACGMEVIELSELEAL